MDANEAKVLEEERATARESIAIRNAALQHSGKRRRAAERLAYVGMRAAFGIDLTDRETLAYGYDVCATLWAPHLPHQPRERWVWKDEEAGAEEPS